MANPVHEIVTQQYEKWVYPEPLMDLSLPEVKRIRNGADPTTRYTTYWPHLPFRDDLDILVAGCGSNSAARYAYHHPEATVTGIDLSSASLAHEAYLKDKHQLTNLTLHQCTIETVASLGQTFDFIDVIGVLHHLPDPAAGLRSLGGVLRPEGVIAVMLYGKYGRAGVYMMQEMFQKMGLSQTDEGLAMVKTALASLPQRHILQGYMKRTRDASYDAGLVDTFLHRQDRAYSVSDCLQFVEETGMSFMGWWDNILYYPEGMLDTGHPLFKHIHSLPEEDIWQIMELYNDTLGQHCFSVCHPDRPVSTYKPNFNDEVLMTYVPVSNAKIVSEEGEQIVIERPPYPVCGLYPVSSAIFRQIDGIKTVSECFDAANITLPAQYDKQSACAEVFQYLWRLSHIFLKMPPV